EEHVELELPDQVQETMHRDRHRRPCADLLLVEIAAAAHALNEEQRGEDVALLRRKAHPLDEVQAMTRVVLDLRERAALGEPDRGETRRAIAGVAEVAALHAIAHRALQVGYGGLDRLDPVGE